MNTDKPLRVVCVRPTLGVWCHCSHHVNQKPAGVPEVMPGTKGTLVHLGDKEATVSFDGFDAPVILPRAAIKTNELEQHIKE